MAIDLVDLVDALKREVSPPGEDLFPDATDDDYVGMLSDAFWEAYLDGLLTDYKEQDGLLLNQTTGGDDPSRDLQQVVVIYAGFKIIRTALRNNTTSFRAKAGPVEYETTSSANVLKDLLAELKERRQRLLDRLADAGVLDTVYIDGVGARTDSIGYGDIWWVK